MHVFCLGRLNNFWGGAYKIGTVGSDLENLGLSFKKSSSKAEPSKQQKEIKLSTQNLAASQNISKMKLSMLIKGSAPLTRNQTTAMSARSPQKNNLKTPSSLSVASTAKRLMKDNDKALSSKQPKVIAQTAKKPSNNPLNMPRNINSSTNVTSQNTKTTKSKQKSTFSSSNFGKPKVSQTSYATNKAKQTFLQSDNQPLRQSQKHSTISHKKSSTTAVKYPN